MTWQGPLERLDPYRVRVPKGYKSDMRVDGIIYATEKMIPHIVKDDAVEQLTNVASLPGVVKHALAMPDIHQGYGFPIGGVAATDFDEGGVISPGGVGYDINCGVRLLRTDLRVEEIQDRIKELVEALFRNVPSGVGSEGKIRLSGERLNRILLEGAPYAVEMGYGWEEDLEHLEEGGGMEGADPSSVSSKAKKRGAPQLGTLGAGNHFLEIQVVEEIYDERVAKAFDIKERGQVTVMIHTGSRGLGHQVCQDTINEMERFYRREGRYFYSPQFDIKLLDRELVAAPINSRPGERYLGAMRAAANFAWSNRQFITHWVRESFESVLGRKADDMGMKIIYDVAHNIGKIEEHVVDGKRMKLVVHRKGATRSFGPGRAELPQDYKDTGQPVLIPGDMGTYSYLLVGTEKAMEESFGSTCHGAGRVMSRRAAKRSFPPDAVVKELGRKGILVKAASRHVISEEAPDAYKDVSDVVDTTHGAGISIKVAKMKPLGVVKG
ncbi:MAG: RtcB family protein [Thermoplasmata archaeon]|nr:RtcB family protein [Thermoplasmata archaeon]